MNHVTNRFEFDNQHRFVNKHNIFNNAVRITEHTFAAVINPYKQKGRMRRIFGLLLMLAISFTSTANDPTNDKSVEITPNPQTLVLTIEVNEELTGTAVTVSVFNSVGEIVLETALGLGENRLDLTNLKDGEYVAVVRENGVYSSKSSFVLNS